MSWLYSQIRTYFKHGISLRATIVCVSPSALKVTIPVSNLTWTPGEHVFLRFLALGLHGLTAHPFTICSSPNARGKGEKASPSNLTFYVQPRGGISGRLAKMAEKQPGLSVPVLLEGPYGGVRSKPLTEYDRSMVIACGAGAGFSLPFVMNWLLDADQRRRYGSPNPGNSPSRKMQVLISTRDVDIIDWYEAALVEFLEANGLPVTLDGVEIFVHLTSGSRARTETSPHDSELGDDKQTASQLAFKIAHGRPDIPAAVKEATLESGVTVGIAVCGPTGVLQATQDAAAEAQLRILGSKQGSKEVYLHSEVFS